MDAKRAGKKLLRYIGIVLLVCIAVIAFLALTGTVAHAAGLVDDTVDAANLYSKYPIGNYQLDFYVDNSWGWLPWNWADGIGKSVQYGLYAITNFIWTISMYLSNATGYVVQEAYKLNFINDTADSIGQSIQTLAGVNANGFASSGFYVGFLLLLVLIVGIYVAYVGLIKRETSKALHAVINFVVVFLLSASFIAFAPDYIKKVNEFSSDISTAALDLGTKIIIPDSESKGKDSVDLIRDSLFSIQVRQPWMLLQFGNSDVEEIGADRVESLLAASPSDEDGATREDIVKAEIEDKDNNYLTIPQVINRLGMVFFLLIFNLGITIFVFLLTAMMIFSQILFIIFAMFLPISFLLSMIPSYESMGKQAIVRVFNTIMMRAGITLIITIAFSISSMFYRISDGYPFFMIAFLQIVTFAGIYFKLGDLMSMFSLNSGDSQNMGRRMMRRPYMFMRQRARRAERRIAKAVGAGAIGGAVLASGEPKTKQKPPTATTASRDNVQPKSTSMGSRVGSAIGAVADTKNRVKDKAKAVKEQVKDIPTQAAYAVHSTKEQAKKNVSDFKRGIVEESSSRQSGRLKKQEEQRQSVAEKRMALQKVQEEKQKGSAQKATAAKAAPFHERPAAAPQPEKQPSSGTAAPSVKERPAAQTQPKTMEREAKPSAQREIIKASKESPSISMATRSRQTVTDKAVTDKAVKRTVTHTENRQTAAKKQTTRKKGRRK